MPVKKCPNGKYRIGKGKCIYKTKKKAQKAYRAYLRKHPEKVKDETNQEDQQN